MKKIGIIGAGQMGLGIAQLFSMANYEVIVNDMSEEILNNALANLDKTLTKLVGKGKMSEEQKSAIKAHIQTTILLNDLADCDLIVEAIVENVNIKKNLFKQLDHLCKKETIFATNTSSISITELASSTNRRESFIGMHFFNPPTIMKLVEVIKGLETSDETFNTVFELAKEIGKEPIEVKEGPGFVVNKILITMINEAICVLEEGIASKESIDTAMKLGANHPMGPLALADLIGNDTVLSIMNTFYTETGDSKYRPARLLKQMVRAGKLGRKTGIGFYDYHK